MARTVLTLHALREVGRDDKDLQQLTLGGGFNPMNNKDPKAMLAEADRKVVGAWSCVDLCVGLRVGSSMSLVVVIASVVAARSA